MMQRRHALALSMATLALLAAGCAQQLVQVNSGEQTVRDRLLLTVDKPWNQFEQGLGDNTPTWTQEGISVDALRLYVGLKDGALIAPTPAQDKAAKPLAFKSTMQPAEVVALFEALVSRDGSSFQLDRLAPQAFAGGNGFRFDFSSVRKRDEVRLRGIGWGVVRNGELFLMTYTAPRLAFFERHLPSVEAMARSARIKG